MNPLSVLFGIFIVSAMIVCLIALVLSFREKLSISRKIIHLIISEILGVALSVGLFLAILLGLGPSTTDHEGKFLMSLWFLLTIILNIFLQKILIKILK